MRGVWPGEEARYILASSPGPTPFWRGIGPGKVSAVCVFTLGRTKKCAANQITVLKHVKLTCDRRPDHSIKTREAHVNTGLVSYDAFPSECVQSFTAPWQWETLVVLCDEHSISNFQLPKLSSCWLVANTTKVSRLPWRRERLYTFRRYAS